MTDATGTILLSHQARTVAYVAGHDALRGSADEFLQTYVPHFGTVINEQNKLVAAGRGQPGARHVPLESLMISNPYSVSTPGREQIVMI